MDFLSIFSFGFSVAATGNFILELLRSNWNIIAIIYDPIILIFTWFLLETTMIGIVNGNEGLILS